MIPDRAEPHEANEPDIGRQRLQDLGDRVCCAGLIAAGLCGLAFVGWMLWQMQPLR